MPACQGRGTGTTTDSDNPKTIDEGSETTTTVELTVTAGEEVALDASNLFGGETTTYEWKHVSGPTIPVADPGASSLSFAAPAVEAPTLLVVSVRATQGSSTMNVIYEITVNPAATGATCGDGTCDDEEDCNACVDDCGTCMAACGNGVCEDGENNNECADDCEPECGNGACEIGENNNDCANDCAVACGNAACESGENNNNCGDDCPVTCGNAACEAGEDNDNCPDDCAVTCGNGACEADENNNTCAADCPVMCGNAACETGENNNNCAADCAAMCGNAACEAGEDNNNCPADCAASCGNGACEAGETNNNCAADCPVMCGNGACEAAENNNTCAADCQPMCSNGACEAGETNANCAADCPAMCGNGVCETGEDNATCAADCPTSCGDGMCSGGEDCNSCQTDCGTCTTVMLTASPGASSDDAEEDLGSGAIDLTSSDLEMTMETVAQKVGIRFALAVPQGAPISRAYVQFTTDETDTTATTLTIAAEATDDAAAFTTATNDVTSRTETVTTATWTPPAWNTVGEAGAAQQTTELKDVIQEVVDRPGWASGNHLVILVSGTGKRVADSYDGSAATAPTLHVEYAGPPAVCGNGTCETGENTMNCAADCPAVPVCGDGTCDPGENSSNCVADCPVVTVCPNGICEAGEDCNTCTADCGACSPNCGNNACDSDEHCATCPGDCMACAGSTPTITRGPYLQMPTTTSVVVKWRTAAATDSVVAYGTTPNSLTSAVTVAGSTTRHEVRIDGLAQDTRYYYAVGESGMPLQGGGPDYYFDTMPAPGVSRPTRIWVIGDSGDAGSDQRAVTDAYLNYAGASEADVWLMLGDNAYSDGTDLEHQQAIFDPGTYQDLLRREAVWPTIGNHERVSVNGASAPYFEIWTLPTQGEAGGVASGTEYYYSFDHGDIHFVCLDSDTHETSTTMMTWLENDLAANDKTWLIAFWHHPPYTNGSHNSDDEGSLGDMRENFVPILESYGVDLVLTGHSHSYERTMLLYGHYGETAQIATQPQVILDSGSGDPSGDGAYTKLAAANCPDISGLPFSKALQAANCGAVYSVVGSSSKTSASDFPTRYNGGTLMPMMHTFQEKLGSVVIDINGNRADVVFLNSGDDGSGTANYSITDKYTLLK